MKEYYVAKGQFVSGDVLVFVGPEFKTASCYIATDYRPGCLGEVWTREEAQKVFDAQLTPREQLPAAFLERYPNL